MKRNSFISRFQFYAYLLLLSCFVVVLAGCKSNEKLTPASTTEETITPIETSNGKGTPAPTEDIPTPEPTPMPSERHVSSRDTMDMENIVNDYFGEEQDFETEMDKRKEYLRAFNILDEKEINIILTYANIMYIRNEADEETRNKYLLFYNDENLKSTVDILDKIMLYNYDHLDDTIIISWLGIGETWNFHERIMLNDYQNRLYSAQKNKKIDEIKFNIEYSTRQYRLYDKDRNGTTVTIDYYNDLGNASKYFMLAMTYNTMDRIYNETKDKKAEQNLSVAKKYLANNQKVMGDLEWLFRPTNVFIGSYCGNPLYDDPTFPLYHHPDYYKKDDPNPIYDDYNHSK